MLQGSPLSPTLFVIYINDLLISLEKINSQPRGYADDISLTNNTLTSLKKSIKIIEKWCEDNKIKLNKEKSGIFKIRINSNIKEDLKDE